MGHQQFLYPTPPQEQLHNNSFSPASPDQWSSASPQSNSEWSDGTVHSPPALNGNGHYSQTSSTPTTDVATDRRGHHLNLIWSLVSKAVLPPILPLDLMCNLVVFKRIIYVLVSASSGHAYPQYCT